MDKDTRPGANITQTIEPSNIVFCLSHIKHRHGPASTLNSIPPPHVLVHKKDT